MSSFYLFISRACIVQFFGSKTQDIPLRLPIVHKIKQVASACMEQAGDTIGLRQAPLQMELDIFNHRDSADKYERANTKPMESIVVKLHSRKTTNQYEKPARNYNNTTEN